MLVGGAVQCVCLVWLLVGCVEASCVSRGRREVTDALLTVLVQPVVGALVWSSVVLVCYC